MAALPEDPEPELEPEPDPDPDDVPDEPEPEDDPDDDPLDPLLPGEEADGVDVALGVALAEVLVLQEDPPPHPTAITAAASTSR